MTASHDSDRQIGRLLVIGAVPLLLSGSVTDIARVSFLASTGFLWGTAIIQWVIETCGRARQTA